MTELSAEEKDTLAEVGNISLGSAATALSNLLGKTVRITAPEISTVTVEEVESDYPVPCLVLQIKYLAGLAGENVLVIKEQDASVIAALMMGMDPQEGAAELGEVEMSAVQEAMNQMMGYASTSLSEMFHRSIDITPPTIEKRDLGEEQAQLSSLETLEQGEEVVQVAFRIEVEGLVDSTMLQIIPLGFAREMSRFLLYGEEPESGSLSLSEGEESPEGQDETLTQEEITAMMEGGQQQEGAPEGEEKGEPPDPGEESPGEAEALRTGGASSEAEGEGEASAESEEVLSTDAIAEVGNISMGSAATALSDLLGKTVRITTPQVNIVSVEEIEEDYPVPYLLLYIKYLSGLAGENVLIVKEQDASVIAALMMGMDPQEGAAELGEVEMSAVQEAMNQMMGYASTALSEMFNRTIDITPPTVERWDLGDEGTRLSSLESLEPGAEVVQVAFRIEVEGLVDSTMLQIIPREFAREMSRYLLYGEEPEMEPSPEAPTEAPAEEPSEAAGGEELLSQEEITAMMEGRQAGESGGEAGAGTPPPSEPAKAAEEGQESANRIYWSREEEPAEAVASGDSLEEKLQQLDLVKDVPVRVDVILGRSQVPLGKLFALGQEGILELDRYHQEPVEVYVDDLLVARGEVVVVNGQLGVRITSLESELHSSGSS